MHNCQALFKALAVRLAPEEALAAGAEKLDPEELPEAR
jgi:hypothetical protein